MPTDSDLDRVLLCPGELRPDLFRLFGAPTQGLDCLIGAPGLLQPFEGSGDLVREPGRRLTKKMAYAHRGAVLRDLARAVDALPRTTEWEGDIQKWMKCLHEGTIRIRHLESAALHTRLVATASASVMPQSPFSLDTAESSAWELVVELTGTEHQKARSWFNGHFERAAPIEEQVLASLAASWAGGWATPRDLYFKVLIEYFRDVVDGVDFEVDDNPMLEHLTEFQRDAYLYAKSILRRYGGVFLADVVGLGKTFIALALLNHLQRAYGEHAVVVAPPPVLETWKDLAAEFRIELTAISIGKLEDLEKHGDRELLVIDESHNFRNAGTLRHDTVQRWLRPGGSASTRKVLLLSATPQNNTPDDVKHQLALFPDNYARLPFRAESMDSWFRDVALGKSSLVDMLQHVVVRRTRRFIAQAHPSSTIRMRIRPGVYEERPLTFPRRVSGEKQTLRYNIDATFGKSFYSDLLRSIANLRYPLHGLAGYAVDGAAEREPIIRRLQRSGIPLRGLFKVLLLKRLESSLHALHVSLTRLLDRLTAAALALDKQKVVVENRQLSDLDDDSDSDLVSDAALQLDSRLFDVERLASDIDADRASVRTIMRSVQELLERADPKVGRLEKYLEARPPREHRTIIFTQFADTALHLGKLLGDRHGRTTVVTGSTRNHLDVIRRFAPRANRFPIAESEQYELLIATDALSEGVNLQDADTLINYDIHWNPVRLIQRAGRIDRIGSTHDEIHIASFLPERELEASLNLEAVLRRRIQEFVQVFGEDSHVLPSSDALGTDEMLTAYTGEALERQDESDDLDGLSRHSERLLRFRREEPAEYARVSELRPGRRALGIDRPPIVATRRSWFWVFWTRQDDGARLEQLDALRALDVMQQHAEATGLHWTLPSNAAAGEGLDIVREAQDAFAPISEEFAQQRTQPRLSAEEAFVVDHLDTFARTCEPTVRPLLERLQSWVRQGHAQSAIRRHGRAWKREKLSTQAVFDETRHLYSRFPPRTETLGEAEVVGAVLKGPA